MEIRLISYKFRGLSKREMQLIARSFIQHLHSHPHFVSRTCIGFRLHGMRLLFVASTKDGIHARQNGKVSIGCGGDLLVVEPHLLAHITNSRSLGLQRVVWVHLERLQWERLGIISIYAPNEPYNKKYLGNELDDRLNRSRQWFLVGDYNMVKVGVDWKGGFGEILEVQEKRGWNRLAQKLCLEDTIRYKKVNYVTLEIVRKNTDI